MRNDSKYNASILESLKIDHDVDFVLDRIKLPNDPNDTPDILGWSGPGRSGTTALLFLLAGHPEVDRVYFQPQKTLMRLGSPTIELHGYDNLICMKETFTRLSSPHDPIETLLKAGVPPEKITWIAMLRDPLQTFGSWYHIERVTPEVFAFWQSYTINLVHKYKNTPVRVVPFTYELIKDQEMHSVKKLLAKAGLTVQDLDLNFNHPAIQRKLVPGQAADEEYFQTFLGDTIKQGKFVYRTNSYPLPPQMVEEITNLCKKSYDEFHLLAKRELNLN
jgi:hypothetical protein